MSEAITKYLFRTCSSVAILAIMLVPSVAGTNCTLGAAEYSGGSGTLVLDSEAGNKMVLTVKDLRLEGVLMAINGGYSAYELSEVSPSGDIGQLELSDTFYSFDVSEDRRNIVSGGWVDDPAPAAVLLSNVNRDLFYGLRDLGRESEFGRVDDLFTFRRCNH